MRAAYMMVPAILAGLLVASTGRGVPAEGSRVTESKLRQYEYEIEVETLKFLQEALNPAKVAEEYGLQPPVYPPSLDPEQVRAIIENEVQKVVEARFPRTWHEQLLKHAENRYRMYRIGEEVNMRIHNRLNKWEMRSGTITAIEENGVLLDGKAVVKINIHESEYPHLWVEHHERAVAAYEAAESAKIEARQRAYTAKARKHIGRRIWREYGYVKLRGRDEWIPRQEYFERNYAKQWDRAYKQVRETMRSTVLARHGYQQDEVSGEWIFVGKPEAPTLTPADVGLQSEDSLLWQLRQLFQNVSQDSLEIEAEKDLEPMDAPAPADDIWGG